MSRNSPAVPWAGVNHTRALSTRGSQRPGAKLAQDGTALIPPQSLDSVLPQHLKSSEECRSDTSSSNSAE